jgi:hypothetical protein
MIDGRVMISGADGCSPLMMEKVTLKNCGVVRDDIVAGGMCKCPIRVQSQRFGITSSGEF